MIEADVVIVGTGHGGAQAAIALRQAGFEGSVLMLGREKNLPYERPPLSKDYLSGKKAFERILIRPEKFWADKDIEIRLGCSVSRIDPQAKQLSVSGGETIGFGKLIWAAGGDARRLSCPGGNFAGVHAVRHKPDVDGLMADLKSGAKRVAVIGGGYIGLEAAAVLSQLDCSVTIIETEDRVLSRVAGEDLSHFFEDEHRRQGVEIRLSSRVESLVGADNRVTGVKLASGEELPCDLVVVGIGIVPSVGPLIAAGAAGADGVDVDDYCRTSLTDVYAIGDCAAHANSYAEGSILRLESVQNANDMASVTAKSICGEPETYQSLPWFWSNQFDLKLQTAGLNLGHDTTVLRGDPDTRSFSVIYLKDNRIIAIDAVNRVKDYVQGRKLIEARLIIADPEVLLDTDRQLKELL